MLETYSMTFQNLVQYCHGVQGYLPGRGLRGKVLFVFTRDLPPGSFQTSESAKMAKNHKPLASLVEMLENDSHIVTERSSFLQLTTFTAKCRIRRYDDDLQVYQDDPIPPIVISSNESTNSCDSSENENDGSQSQLYSDLDNWGARSQDFQDSQDSHDIRGSAYIDHDAYADHTFATRLETDEWEAILLCGGPSSKPSSVPL